MYIRKVVFIKMECFDFCLWNEICDFFELKIKKKRQYWICVIKVCFMSSYVVMKLVKVGKWIYFNVSLYYFYQVSFVVLL